MNRVALLGVGLMGGSIGLALKARGVPLKISAYARREETRRQALERGMADDVFDSPVQAVEGADLVVVCVPVRAIPEVLRQAVPGLSPEAVVTDVGSTKSWLASECAAVLKDHGAVFVGSHPMCGSEKAGLEVADADLYRDACCIVCSDEDTRSEVWKVTNFWTRIGARVVEMPAVRHDRLAARSSHVPHVAAAALVLGAGEDADALRPLVGPGFRDTTRIASGSPVLWRDILDTNADSVVEGLDAVIVQLEALKGRLAAGDGEGTEAWLAEAAEARTALLRTGVEAAAPVANGVVAIDGPSASGKSTVARKVAARMNALYVDSGAMYRGMTWQVLREGVDPESEPEVVRVMEQSQWTFEVRDGVVGFTINGEDPGEAIRGEAVRENVSYVARIPRVRRFIVDRIRGMRAMGPLVVEGRDIGSVIFPESPHKFYLDADPVERARRRNQELQATEGDSSEETVAESLRKRDHLDSTRKTAPLQVADGAQVVDTTRLTLDEVVERILERVEV